jgi:hypothetical protein
MSSEITFVFEACERHEVEAEIEYDFSPGVKGVRYTRNGDGWPDEPPSVELTRYRCVSINGHDIPRDWQKFADAAVRRYIENHLQERAEEQALEAESCYADAGNRDWDDLDD